MHSQYLAQFSSYRSDSTCSEKPFSFCFERYMVRRISCYFRRSVFAHHTYSDLPLCDHHISLSSHRIVPIRPVLKSYFHSVSNDIRYVVVRATFGDRLSSITLPSSLGDQSHLSLPFHCLPPWPVGSGSQRTSHGLLYVCMLISLSKRSQIMRDMVIAKW